MMREERNKTIEATQVSPIFRNFIWIRNFVMNHFIFFVIKSIIESHSTFWYFCAIIVRRWINITIQFKMIVLSIEIRYLQFRITNIIKDLTLNWRYRTNMGYF